MASIDPVTLFHSLMWRLKCFEASPEEFEQLFFRVAETLNAGEFLRIRPYGNAGDRKMDGTYWAEGTIFQVYSPDFSKQSELASKMREDFEGARNHHGSAMKGWTFVHNVRRGNPPDVKTTLDELRAENADIEVGHMSSSDLWDRLRDGARPQVVAEILGAPPADWENIFAPGFDTNTWESADLSDVRMMILHDTLRGIDAHQALDALRPERCYGVPLRLRPADDVDWSEKVQQQAADLEAFYEPVRDVLARVAVFPLSDIPLAVHLGYVLTDQIDVRLFQYHRDRRSWTWDPDEAEPENDLRTSFPEPVRSSQDEVVLRVSLSARVLPDQTMEAVGRDLLQIDVEVPDPDVMWLRHPNQLVRLEAEVRTALKVIRREAPECRRIHLFYAGPAPGAVSIGRAINPRMTPPVSVYDFRQQRTPQYEEALRLEAGR